MIITIINSASNFGFSRNNSGENNRESKIWILSSQRRNNSYLNLNWIEFGLLWNSNSTRIRSDTFKLSRDRISLRDISMNDAEWKIKIYFSPTDSRIVDFVAVRIFGQQARRTGVDIETEKKRDEKIQRVLFRLKGKGPNNLANFPDVGPGVFREDIRHGLRCRTLVSISPVFDFQYWSNSVTNSSLLGYVNQCRVSSSAQNNRRNVGSTASRYTIQHHSTRVNPL